MRLREALDGVPGPPESARSAPSIGSEIRLQVEGGGPGRPLLVVGQPGEAGSEGVGYAELQNRLMLLSPPS